MAFTNPVFRGPDNFDQYISPETFKFKSRTLDYPHFGGEGLVKHDCTFWWCDTSVGGGDFFWEYCQMMLVPDTTYPHLLLTFHKSFDNIDVSTPKNTYGKPLSVVIDLDYYGIESVLQDTDNELWQPACGEFKNPVRNFCSEAQVTSNNVVKSYINASGKPNPKKALMMVDFFQRSRKGYKDFNHRLGFHVPFRLQHIRDNVKFNSLLSSKRLSLICLANFSNTAKM